MKKKKKKVPKIGKKKNGKKKKKKQANTKWGGDTVFAGMFAWLDDDEWELCDK